jgi:hypothetical protein
MAKPDALFDLLRSCGLRKRVAKPLAALEGNSRRDGTKGERLARQTVEDLTSAADAIERRILRRDRTRTQAARKAAQTRKRNSAKRSANARKSAKTRGKAAGSRSRARKASRR